MDGSVVEKVGHLTQPIETFVNGPN